MSFIKKYWVAGVLVLVFTMFLFHIGREDSGKVIKNEEHPLVSEIDEGQKTEPENGEIVVDIKGAVHRPGIYEGTADMRVHEIVSLAGGFTDEADETSVNLAQKIEDEMVVLVYSLQPEEHKGDSNTPVNQEGDKVRINHATLDEITSINGIGPSKAEAIIAYREENGMFKKIEELLEVSGIGEKTLENMKEDILIP